MNHTVLTVTLKPSPKKATLWRHKISLCFIHKLSRFRIKFNKHIAKNMELYKSFYLRPNQNLYKQIPQLVPLYYSIKSLNLFNSYFLLLAVTFQPWFSCCNYSSGWMSRQNFERTGISREDCDRSEKSSVKSGKVSFMTILYIYLLHITQQYYSQTVTFYYIKIIQMSNQWWTWFFLCIYFQAYHCHNPGATKDLSPSSR